MKRRRNDTAKNEPGNRGRVKGRGGERILAKGANTEGAHGTHGLHGRAEAEADNRQREEAQKSPALRESQSWAGSSPAGTSVGWAGGAVAASTRSISSAVRP